MDIDEFLDPSYDASASSSISGPANLQALTRAWINERGAPEILPYRYALSQTSATTYTKMLLQMAYQFPGREDDRCYQSTD